MNQSSTVTLLELVNRVLLNTGEQPVRTVTETVAAKRAMNSVKRAVTDIMLLGEWTFARAIVTPTGWDDVTQTMTHSLNQVEDVWVDNLLLRHETWQVHAQSHVDVGTPQCWVQVNYETVRLAPYPDTSTKGLVRLVGYKYPTPMVLDTDVPEVPDVFVDALVSRATGAFLIRHLGDPGLGNQFNNEFEVSLQQLRDTDRGVPRRAGNMLNRARL